MCKINCDVGYFLSFYEFWTKIINNSFFISTKYPVELHTHESFLTFDTSYKFFNWYVFLKKTQARRHWGDFSAPDYWQVNLSAFRIIFVSSSREQSFSPLPQILFRGAVPITYFSLFIYAYLVVDLDIYMYAILLKMYSLEKLLSFLLTFLFPKRCYFYN